jgi:PilZ domain-containing protein
MVDESNAYNTDAEIHCSEEFMGREDTEIDRRFPRIEVHSSAEATIYPPDGAAAPPVRCTVLVRNLSQGGFGIRHTEMLQPRQRIELEVESKRLAGEVRWCRLIQDGFYIAGCQLIVSE